MVNDTENSTSAPGKESASQKEMAEDACGSNYESCGFFFDFTKNLFPSLFPMCYNDFSWE